MSLRSLGPLLALSWVLISCSGPFTASQRAGLATVAVAPTVMAADALEEVYGGDIQAHDFVFKPGNVTRTEFARFQTDNRADLARIKTQTPTDLGELLTARITRQLEQDAFFKGRVRAQSGNTVSSHISSVRLVRSGFTTEGILAFDTEIYADIHLRDPHGKKLAGKTYIKNGGVSRPVSDFAKNPEELKSAYAAALNQAVTAFMADLAAKTRH